MDKILVPIDYTEITDNALKYSKAAFPKAQITVLHVNNRSKDSNYRTVAGQEY